MVQRYRKMEDQKHRHALLCIPDFAKGGGFEPKLEKFSKNCKLGKMASKLV